MRSSIINKLYIILLITILISISLSNLSAWAVPHTINYQGKLTGADGNALSGEYIMTFRLYWIAESGSSIWDETQSVTVTEGIYNVKLGAKNPMEVGLFNNDDNVELYLEVEIEGEVLSPRQCLTSTVFAMKAADADTLDGASVNELEESNEINTKLAEHSADPHVHHNKTTSFAELTDMATDVQIPNDITINYAAQAGNSDTLDGKHANEFGDGHSLDADSGIPEDVVYVDKNGNVGIGTTNPFQKLSVTGIIESINGGFKFPDGSIQKTAQANPRADNLWLTGEDPYICLNDQDEGGLPFSGSEGESRGDGDDWYIMNQDGRLEFKSQPGNEITLASNGGRVGIGVVDPSDNTTLQIGDAYRSHFHYNGGTNGQSNYITYGVTGKTRIRWYDNLMDHWETVGDWNNSGLHLGANKELTVKGRVGIGTDNPSINTTLQVGATGRSHLHYNGGTNNQSDFFTIGINGKIQIIRHDFFMDNDIATLGQWDAYGLKVNGKLEAKEIEVKTDVFPDYVFKEDYELMSLEDVEEYVKTNQHLPRIPSQEEVIANGINVGDTQVMLLEKIEELTLHLIEQNKRIKELEKVCGD